MVVTAAEDGGRVDRVVTRWLTGVSRVRVQQCIRTGALQVNGRQTKASHVLRRGDRIRVELPETEPPLDVSPEEIPLQILYRDDQLVIIDKPAGLVVHPGAGIRQGTLANALVHHFGRLPGTEELRPGIVHRLDRDTSGVMMVTLTAESKSRMAEMFRRRELHKEYQALVYGAMNEPQGVIEKPVGRHPVHRLKMTTRAPRSRPCKTEWSVIRQFPAFTQLRVILHTGRTHQIRVHLASLGRPIVGDLLYGGRRHLQINDMTVRQAIEGLGRFFLHACRLRFVHPFSGDVVDVTAPLPSPLTKFLQLLEQG
ncbi:MAG: RluA family pseudouridine synthase [Acidobacteria bacterium]|nr:RluA family pseudouridine synthase [Acidobacteriota bacterium]